MICFEGDGNEYWQTPEIPRRFFDWRDNPLEGAHKVEGARYYKQALLTDNACWMLSHSPTIRASFETYKELPEMPITAVRMLEFGDYCSDEKRIHVNRTSSRPYRVGTVAHELRHGIQDIEGVLTNRKNQSRRSNVLLTEGDAVAYEITVSFELRDTFPKVWKTLKQTNDRYYKLCRIFEDVVEVVPNSMQSGYATQQVLESYLSIPYGRKVDFDHYFQKPKKFRKPISPSRALRSLSAYYESLMGIPYCETSNGAVAIIERDDYLDPGNTATVVDKLRGLTV